MDQLNIRISRKMKNIAIFTLLFLVLIHGYRYFSPMYSHDSLGFTAQTDAAWKISLGRFMQPIYWKIRGQLAVPYTIGILTYVWLALAVYLVADLLNIQSSVAQFLLAGSMTGSLALVSSNAAYIHESDTFMLALFLGVLAAWICLKPVKKLEVLAPVLLLASVALYQAYIQVYVTLVMIWAIIRLLERGGVLRIALQCLKAAIYALIGMALYAVVWKYVLRLTGIMPEAGYNGLTDVGNYEGLSLLNLIKETWTYPFQYLMSIRSRNYYMALVPRVFLLTYACCAVIYALLRNRRSAVEAAMTAAIVWLLPAGMNCMYLISKGLVHDLIVYSFCFADVFAIAAAEHAASRMNWEGVTKAAVCLKRCVIGVVPLMFYIMFFDKVLYANQIYLKKDLAWDSTLSVMTRVVDRLEQLDGYQAGQTPVALYGELDDAMINRENPAFAGVKSITGVGGNYSTTYEQTYWWYIEDVMGYAVKKYEHAEEIKELVQVKQMPAFPEEGCVQIIDGVAVMKLSDIEK